MAHTVRVGASVDLGGLAKDLDAVAVGLGRQVGKAVALAAQPVAAATARSAPFDPEHRADRPDGLGHLRDSFTARSLGPIGAAIVSTHPAAPVFEFGGTIAPKGVPITIRAVEMAHKAAVEQAPVFEAAVASAVSRLLGEHNL